MENKNDARAGEELLKDLKEKMGEKAEEVGKLFLDLDEDERLIMLFLMGLKVLAKLDKEDMLVASTLFGILMKTQKETTTALLCVLLQSVRAKVLELSMGGQENE